MPRPTAVAISRSAHAGNLSPEHKRFRKLQDQIEGARKRLLDWQQQGPLFAQAHAAKVQPLQHRHEQALREWAFELEQLLLGRKWSRADQATLARAIAELAAELLDGGEDADEALMALHDRHADTPFGQEAQQQLEEVRTIFESVRGMDLGDAPIGSMEELMRRAHEQMAHQREQATQQHEQAHDGRGSKGRGKRKSAAQRRAEADAAQVSQTVREVYRKLASALHPDRAGAGAGQQAERTTLMAQANAAYAAGDLLALLNLQLVIEQVDAAHVAGIAAAQVKHFNKVLDGQLAELQAEVEQRERAFCAAYGWFETRPPDPNQLGRALKDAVRDALAAAQLLQADQRALRGEPAAAKAWVRAMREQQQFDDDLDGLLP